MTINKILFRYRLFYKTLLKTNQDLLDNVLKKRLLFFFLITHKKDMFREFSRGPVVIGLGAFTAGRF